MTRKADFNAEEWSLVLEGPPVAGMIVAAAHRGGTFREAISMGKAYQEAQKEQSASSTRSATSRPRSCASAGSPGSARP
jgi:hypothetical protein